MSIDTEAEKVRSRVRDFQRALTYAVLDKLPDSLSTATLEKLRTEFHQLLGDLYKLMVRQQSKDIE